MPIGSSVSSQSLEDVVKAEMAGNLRAINREPSHQCRARCSMRSFRTRSNRINVRSSPDIVRIEVLSKRFEWGEAGACTKRLIMRLIRPSMEAGMSLLAKSRIHTVTHSRILVSSCEILALGWYGMLMGRVLAD